MLTSLIDVPISLIVSNKDTLPIRPGSQFEFPIVLTNEGECPVGWSHENPLKLSYRWLTEDGVVIERDGRRTAIPFSPLPPGSRVELELEGSAPDDEGCYQLQLSLVLEGVHWACDVGNEGWVQRVTNVTPAPAWPTDLNNSRGGRALRGAMVAAELARHLDKRTFAVKPVQTEPVKAGATKSSPTTEPKSIFQPMRDWIRALLGVRGLEQQLVDVIALATSQEQRGRELETQIVTLKEELQVDFKLLKDRATRPQPNFTDTRYDASAPSVASQAGSQGPAVKVSRPTSRPSKGSSKSGKISREPAR